MIRINLITRKVSKKKVGLVQNLVMTGVGLLIVLVVIGYFWVSLNGKLSNLRQQVAAAEAEKAKLKDVNSQKKKYEQTIAKLKNKLDVITKIKQDRFLPIRLFDELTKVLDSDMPVWLTSFAFDKAGNIKIEGFSLSNPDLAAFVTKLEGTPFFEKVELLYSEKVKQEDREIFRFSLTAASQRKGDPSSTSPG